MNINYGVNRKVGNKIEHKNGSFELPEYIDDDFNKDEVKAVIRNEIRKRHTGWLITGYGVKKPQNVSLTNCCAKPRVKDLTQGKGELRHYYCANCKGHSYRGTIWTAKEWEEWINE